MTNPTRKHPTNQRNYGRVPEDFRPQIAALSHLEAHVFTMLTLSAVRSTKEPNVGCVNISKSALAREMGIDRTSLKRAIKGLFDSGLLRGGESSCPSSWGIMPQYLGHYALPPESSGPTPRVIMTQEIPVTPTELKVLPAPIGSEEVSEEVVEAVAAGNGHKKPRRRPSWLIWNSAEEQLRSRPGEEFQERKDAFFKLWADRLGNEEALYEQLSEADKWLKRNPAKRGKVKRFDMFFGKWLDRCLEG